jgi:nucleoside phosphorylase
VERIAIFAALSWECAPVLRQMRQVSRGRLAEFTAWRTGAAGNEVWLVKTGVGIRQADAAARAVCGAAGFGLFLSTGCAGALAPELAPGDVTVATAVIGNPAGKRFETDASHRARACRAAQRAGLRAVVGPVLCSPEALASAAAKQAAAQTGSVAVEMEGAPIAARAAQAGVPFVSVRAVLDTAGTELRHVGRFIEPQSGAVKPLALAAYLATHPGAVTDLLAMQRMVRAAQSSLQRFFGAWFAEE